MKTAFVVVPNTREKGFLSSPHMLAQIYGHIVKDHPTIHHVRIVDDPLFQFMLANDVQLLAYS